jgi:hypothetical protein
MGNEPLSPLLQYINFVNSTLDMFSYWRAPAGLKTSFPLKDQIEMMYLLNCVDASKVVWETFGFKEKDKIIGKKFIELTRERTYDRTFSEFINNNYQLKDYQVHVKLLSGKSFYGIENWLGLVETGAPRQNKVLDPTAHGGCDQAYGLLPSSVLAGQRRD